MINEWPFVGGLVEKHLRQKSIYVLTIRPNQSIKLFFLMKRRKADSPMVMNELLFVGGFRENFQQKSITLKIDLN